MNKFSDLSGSVLAPAEFTLLELPLQINGAACLILTDSSAVHCFVQ